MNVDISFLLQTDKEIVKKKRTVEIASSRMMNEEVTVHQTRRKQHKREELMKRVQMFLFFSLESLILFVEIDWRFSSWSFPYFFGKKTEKDLLLSFFVVEEFELEAKLEYKKPAIRNRKHTKRKETKCSSCFSFHLLLLKTQMKTVQVHSAKPVMPMTTQNAQLALNITN